MCNLYALRFFIETQLISCCKTGKNILTIYSHLNTSLKLLVVSNIS